MTAALCFAIAVWGSYLLVATRRHRRRVEAFAETAGIRRQAGESTPALLRRAARRFRILDRPGANRRA